MKKIGSLFVVALVAFFGMVTSSKAMTVTLDNVGDLIDTVAPDVDTAYVVGKYVFTANHQLNVQDVMLAARSIDSSKEGEEGLDDMVIYQIRREKDKDTGVATGKWVKRNNFVGSASASLGDTFEIDYVDYEGDLHLQSTVEVSSTLDETASKQVSKYFGPDYEQDDSIELVDGVLTGDVYYVDHMPNWSSGETPHYFVSLVIEVPDEYQDKATYKIEETGDGPYNYKDSLEDGIILYVVGISEATSKLTVVVDYDGDEDLYEPNQLEIDLSGLNFVKSPKVEGTPLATNEVENQTTASTAWGYTLANQKDVTYTDGKFSGTLKHGDLTKENIFNEEESTGYYIAYRIELKKYNKAATVTLPCGSCEGGTKTVKVVANDDLDVLFSLNPKKSLNKEIKVKFDGDAYEEFTINLDFSGITFQPITVTEALDLSSAPDKATYEKNLSDVLGYSGNDPEAKLEGNKITGTITKKSDVRYNGMNNPAVEGYYFAVVLKVDGANSKTTIKDPKTGKVITYDAFDTTDTISLLKKLDESAGTKNFTFEVDVDGEDDAYAPYTYVFDYSSVSFTG